MDGPRDCHMSEVSQRKRNIIFLLYHIPLICGIYDANEVIYKREVDSQT